MAILFVRTYAALAVAGAPGGVETKSGPEVAGGRGVREQVPAPMVDLIATDMEAMGEAKRGVATRAVRAQAVALPVRPARAAVVAASGHPGGAPGAPTEPRVDKGRPAIKVVSPRRAAGRTATGGTEGVTGSRAQATLAAARAKRGFAGALPRVPVAPTPAQ